MEFWTELLLESKNDLINSKNKNRFIRDFADSEKYKMNNIISACFKTPALLKTTKVRERKSESILVYCMDKKFDTEWDRKNWKFHTKSTPVDSSVEIESPLFVSLTDER